MEVNSLTFNHTTLSRLINNTNEHNDIIHKYVVNQAVDEPAYTTLIVMYSILITVGSFGNMLVILSVVRKRTMQTPRNMFIVNLAVSDLLLCTITLPLTLMEILTKHFPFRYNFVCKMITALQTTSTFVSTISITAIALDRYQVIVYPTKDSLHLCGAVLILVCIWCIALLLAAPLFIYKELIHNELNMTDIGLNAVDFCVEDWPIAHGRAYYSIFGLIFQYILPIIIVSAAYMRISYKLRCRYAAGFVSKQEPSQNTRRKLRGRHLQRTNILLSSIAVVFFVSWLPLNLFNLTADVSTNLVDFNQQSTRIWYAVCHMVSMSSALFNPVFYGCLNDNFWKEFVDILCLGRRVAAGECNKPAVRKLSQRVFRREKGDLLTASTDCNQGATVNTEMSSLTKC